MDRQIEISLGGQEFVVHRARLGLYLSLLAVATRLEKASEEQDSGAIVKALLSYLNLCLPESLPLVALPWQELILAYISLVELNHVDDENFAILRFRSDGDPAAWDYPDRVRYLWVHLIASRYHWTRESIENLWPEEALAFIQEITADEQAEREFYHALSEVAYSYDEGTKKSRYVPLTKPAWMVAKTEKQVTTRLYKGFMPIGVIVAADGKEEEVSP